MRPATPATGLGTEVGAGVAGGVACGAGSGVAVGTGSGVGGGAGAGVESGPSRTAATMRAKTTAPSKMTVPRTRSRCSGGEKLLNDQHRYGERGFASSGGRPWNQAQR